VVRSVVLGPAAGAWVDRVRRRSIMMATDLGRAAVLASIPIAHAIGHVTLAQLGVAAVLVGGLTVFFDVAYPKYLPAIVESTDLARSNSLLQVSEQGAAVLGPGLAGWLIGLVGVHSHCGAAPIDGRPSRGARNVRLRPGRADVHGWERHPPAVDRFVGDPGAGHVFHALARLDRPADCWPARRMARVTGRAS